MASFDPIDAFSFDPSGPPPRPTTPPVRKGFLLVLASLSALAALVYGVPFVAGRVGYAYEAGRARAASEALAGLDEAGAITKASALFRLASTAAAPAVVHISVYRSIEALPDGGAAAGAQPGPARPGLVRTSTGSGVVIDRARGHVVTNNHVVQGADFIGVRFGRGDEVRAQIVGADPKTDLAVIRVPGPLRSEAAWGDSEQLDIGDWVLAIGSPFELDRTVTAGIVSATGRSHLRLVGADSYEDFIQTDAAINPGNSGGPLVNLRGEVVGINAAILSETGGNQGIGLAISSNLARRIVEAIIKDGKVVRGYLGVEIGDLTEAEARELKVPEPGGVLVSDVEPGSPADRSGLRPGDVVVRLGESAVADVAELRNRTASLPIGDVVPIRFVRDGRPAEAHIRIEPMPARLVLGLRVKEVGPPQATQFPRASETVLLVDGVDPAGAAGRAGIVPGLRIYGVGETRVDGLAQLDAALAALDPVRGIPLQLQAPGGRTRTIVVGGSGNRPSR